MFRHQFFYIDLAGLDEGREVAFDGGNGKVAPGGNFGDRNALPVELQAEMTGAAFFPDGTGGSGLGGRLYRHWNSAK